MGYMRHHAILVTGWGDAIESLHARAEEMFHGVAWVSPLSPPQINNYRSFFVAPDGSKEGWATSDAGDAAREDFILSIGDSDCSAWAEVQFGDEDGDDRILRKKTR